MREIRFCYCKKLRLKHLTVVDNLLKNELTVRDKKYFPHTKIDIVRQLTNIGDYFYVIVDQDEEVVAYGQMRTFNEKYKRPALGIVISKFCRGSGFGELLCKYMIQDMKKEGYEEVMLKVHKENKKAQKLYKKLGFKQYKKDRTFIWMRKDLNE